MKPPSEIDKNERKATTTKNENKLKLHQVHKFKEEHKRP